MMATHRKLNVQRNPRTRTKIYRCRCSAFPFLILVHFHPSLLLLFDGDGHRCQCQCQCLRRAPQSTSRPDQIPSTGCLQRCCPLLDSESPQNSINKTPGTCRHRSVVGRHNISGGEFNYWNTNCAHSNQLNIIRLL